MKFSISLSSRARIFALNTRVTDVRAVCADLEIPVRSSSPQRATGLCPFHTDGHSSFSAFIGRDGAFRFRCHACGVHGDLIDLVALLHGLATRGREFHLALELAEKLAGGLPAVAEPATRAPHLDDDQFDAVAASLLRNAPAVDDAGVNQYLLDRGVARLAHRDGWGGLPASLSEQRGLIEAVVAEVGDSAWHNSALPNRAGEIICQAHRVLIPWRSPDGRITSLQRRRLDDRDPRYVVAQDRGIKWPYGTERLFVLEDGRLPVVICEGAMDALAYRELASRQGQDAVVIAIPSATAWTSSWVNLLYGRRVVVAVDADGPGHAVAAEMMRDLFAAGVTDLQRVVPKNRKDWAEELEAWK